MPGRRLYGALASAVTGAAIALVAMGSSEERARAGAGASDAASRSAFVVQAQLGRVLPPPIDQVELMCGLLTSCDRLPIPPSAYPQDFATCVRDMAEELASPSAVQFSLTLRECGLQSESCASLRACALHGASPDACKGRGRQGMVGLCDVDGRALTCVHDEVLAVRDCTRGNEQCIVMDGRATCTLGACPASSSDADRPHCSASGAHLLRCESGKLASLDCAALGLKCQVGADGAASCATTGPVCSGAGRRCEGATAVSCLSGHEVRVECGAAGLACASAVDGGVAGACVAPAGSSRSECDSAEPARCEGESIRYCQGGRVRTYSCTALGFRKCAAGKGGVRCAN